MTSRQPGPEWLHGLRSAGWALRVLPLALLILLALAGLRGSVGKPHWDGPAHRAASWVGVGLVVILAVLFVITWLRRRRALDAAARGGEWSLEMRLRGVLLVLLGSGIGSAIIVLLAGAHLHWFKPQPQPQRTQTRPTASAPTPFGRQPSGSGGGGLSIPVSDILYGLLVVALISAILLSIWWSKRLRPAIRLDGEPEDIEDAEDLREAVESGRSALLTLDDARAAIIACYAAMEHSLADRGAARAAADTPDELLDRAIRGNIVHGTAPRRLTALFYEARFSSHPMDQAQRQAAERALDELAAALAERSAAAEAST